jgi:hypothetical protein
MSQLGQKATSSLNLKASIYLQEADVTKGEAPKDSLISNQFSLFRSYKFPVRILAAIRQKWPVLRHFLMKTTVGQGSSSRISLYFSLLAGEFGTETGSRWTGSSANYFNYLG